jgi:hypothetical protein
MKSWACAIGLALAAATGAEAAAPPTPLFAGDEPIHIVIRGPITKLADKRPREPHPGSLTLANTGTTYPIALTPRGITRLQSDVCAFPPLRVEFTSPPPAGSLFHHQKRLKLVTHCRRSADFQQKVLLEYAAYRMFNMLTPVSFRARLANIDYVDDNGRPYASRVGFFIEDIDDVARRNGLWKPQTADRVAMSQLEPVSAARFAMFNYVIGNLDWSMRAGPEGEGCCHNGRLLGASRTAASALAPVPYDFDFSGLVDAPYAVPPDGIGVRSVRQRLYRGYCAHNAHAQSAAAEISARQAELVGALAAVPGLTEDTRRRAAAYLDGAFKDLATGKPLRSCIG